ncbi:hypothetical protein BDF22DRAFT_116882 [Syncephalis plumigaleata]|nr:hypothetical protein BDF22DRAFT_116882 [Syncephalis plumigaleata]
MTDYCNIKAAAIPVNATAKAGTSELNVVPALILIGSDDEVGDARGTDDELDALFDAELDELPEDAEADEEPELVLVPEGVALPLALPLAVPEGDAVLVPLGDADAEPEALPLGEATAGDSEAGDCALTNTADKAKTIATVYTEKRMLIISTI